jgi:hypothetical protein
MSNDTIPTKICTKCGQEFPATLEYFYASKRGYLGLRADCKACKDIAVRENRAKNKERIIQRRKERYQNNKEKEREYNRQYRATHAKEIAEYSREYYKRNRPEGRKSDYQTNREVILQQQKKYRQENQEKEYKRKRLYQQNNREKVLNYQRQWKENNRDKIRIYSQRRDARKRNLPDTYTVEEWLACLEYFNHCCAVCGAQLRDLFGEIEPHADHWIALNDPDCPGTVAENMVCLCNGCNVSKQDTQAIVWLIKKFGKSKAKQILMRIEAYFEGVS